MRKFTTLTIDNKTNKKMVYSECSYNGAMFQLENELYKKGIDIFYTKQTIINDVPLMKIRTTRNELCYYYDENRGYLLKD